MIDLQNLTYAYQNSAPIFQSYSWKVEPGEAWSVIGPSGCGKTTLLYLLAGLRFPTAGTVLIGDQPLYRPRPQTGLILQDYGLLPWATVKQNAMLGLKVRRFYGPDGKHAPQESISDLDVDPWLDRLGLSAFADKYPQQISGGQRQRTAIARTLALHPDLLLMDEPFSSLDAPTREGLQKQILEIWAEQRLTLVIVTHAIEEAVLMGQKILLLGRPPNIKPIVIDNPQAENLDYQDSTRYTDLVRYIRQQLEVIE
ncbi:MAG TPA: ATP-binding cassette domain-containing protein [Anaerolineales bacterium]|nr:ATP-binding cassette domain-containing protein [Anaerolineales bacterium]